MSVTAASPISAAAVARRVRGRVVTPEDPDYDAIRRVVAGHGDTHPALVIRAADADDVAEVIGLARETGVELAVRSGGHSGAGHSSTEGGIVLDLRDMTTLEFDLDGRFGWADGGLTAAVFTDAAGEHGLAVGFGDTGSVGLGGLTTGGGVGYLVRKLGLTIDSLLAADVVTADGRRRRVDGTTEPDLFWAIRGGGGARTCAGEDCRGVGLGRRLCRLRLLQGAQHRLRRRGLSSGVAQTLFPGRIHGSGVDERKRILSCVGVCARMSSPRYKTAAAERERARAGV